MKRSTSPPHRPPCRVGVLLLVALAAAGPAAGLDPGRDLTQYARALWRRVDGLPQNAVTALATTPDGFLWVGTQEGLARFDGVAFTVFDKGNSDAFDDHFVTALAVGEDGTLWVGTRRGLLRLTEGGLKRFGGEELPEIYVRALYSDHHGQLWVGTYGRGLVCYHDGEWKTFGEAEGMPDLTVRALAEDAAGDIWAGTSRGLARLHEGVVEVFDSADGLPGDFVRALAAGPEGELWIGSEGGGLARRGADGRFASVRDLPERGFETVEALFEDGDGNLWIGTHGGGLGRLSNGNVEAWNAAEGFAHDVVWCFLEDAEGSLWVGTRGGLLQLRDGSVTLVTRRQGLSHDFVRSVLEDREGNLWIGVPGGVDRLQGGAFEHLDLPGVPAGHEVRAIHQGRDGAVWLGAHGTVTRILGSSVVTFGAAEGLPGRDVNALAEDAEGRLCVGTGGGGLARLDGGRFTVFTQADGLPGDTVRALLPGRGGELWIGTESGLARHDGVRFEVPAAVADLAEAIVLSLYEDAQGVLWIGTSGDGLFRLAGGRLSRVTRRQGLFDDLVFALVEDDAGFFWMSSNRGLWRVPRRNLEQAAEGRLETVRTVSFDEADGMASAECNGGSQPAGVKGSDGRLWFATARGLAVVDPAGLRHNEVPPPVRIEALLADGRRLEPPADETALTLAPDTLRLEIHYTAPSFVSPEKVSFRFRLAGFDDGWVEAGARRTAYYTHLPPGEFRFQVWAANSDGVASREAATVRIERLPFFYERRAFLPACFAVALVLAIAASRYRARLFAARQKELVELVDRRTRDLAEANRALERLASVDSVTGVANHRRFKETLEAEWRRAARSGSPLSVLMIDIDFFKRYNDTYGHQAGDECLRRVAEALDGTVHRPGDLIARYGGEEFAAVLPGTDVDSARQVGEKMRRAVEELQLEHAGSAAAAHVSVSVGAAAAVPGEGRGPDDLLGAADRALYRAKEDGRNQVW